MNCKDIEKLIESQPLKEITAEQIVLMQTHAETCDKCQALLSAEFELQFSLEKLEEPDAPGNLVASVMTRIDNAKSNKVHGLSLTKMTARNAGAIAMLAVGFTITLGLYSYQLFQGQSTLFNIFSLWNGEWSQWIMTPLQFNQVGLGLACGFVCYALGFLLMLDLREDKI